MIKTLVFDHYELEEKLNEIEMFGGHVISVAASSVRTNPGAKYGFGLNPVMRYMVVMRLPEAHPYRDRGHPTE